MLPGESCGLGAAKCLRMKGSLLSKRFLSQGATGHVRRNPAKWFIMALTSSPLK